MSKPNEGLILDILQIIPYPLCFVFLVKITNITDNNMKYDMRYFTSSNGKNMLYINPSFTCDGISLLKNGQLKKGENVIGLIAIQKNYIATNSPVLVFAGKKHKVKKKSGDNNGKH